MEAIVLHQISDLRYEQIGEPHPSPNEVRVKIGFCGVCGSDIPRCFVKGTYSFPTVCGHEFAGVIDSVGPGVTAWKSGDRVAVFPLLWRDDHPACEVGKYAQSDGYDYLGSRSNGGFAEFVVAPVRNLLRVPDSVPLEIAAMTEPAAVALHAARRARLQFGETVAIFGLGPIGLMLAQWVRSMGAARTFLFDVQDYKLDLARQLDFHDVFDSRHTKPSEVIEQLTGGRGAHIAIEAAGVPPAMLDALHSTRRSGRVVLLGNPSADVTLPMALISQVMRRELEILGTWNSDFSIYGDDDDWRSTLLAMENGTLKLRPLISHTLPLSSGIKALHMMRDQSEPYTKVLLHPENNSAAS